jgi:hypothetical protein
MPQITASMKLTSLIFLFATLLLAIVSAAPYSEQTEVFIYQTLQ